MGQRGFGAVGTVVTIGVILFVGIAGWRLAGPHLRKGRMETALGDLLARELRAGDEELIAAAVEEGRRVGLTIPEDAVAVSREGRRVRLSVSIADEADLLVVKVPSSSVVNVERETSWARGVVDGAQEKVDRAVKQQEDRFSNAPLD